MGRQLEMQDVVNVLYSTILDMNKYMFFVLAFGLLFRSVFRKSHAKLIILTLLLIVVKVALVIL